ncbi:MAG: SAM-dependent chlorinase/fluorinase [Planctomycetaceae bacterium]|nr:SAM-dependent chlorinase/fluorinase [Planctomycetaceae bacterium]
MSQPGILTLTTDFGTDGPYVAAVKGVILGLAPGTQLIDVTHTVSPQNILEGAFVLAGIVDAFPKGTVHLVVIDPGVGTDRRLIAVALADQWFVLPDNGLISALVRTHMPTGIWEIANPSIYRAPVSSTFHGRDILAPAAAHLLLGRDPAELGPVRTKVVTIKSFEATRDESGFVGEVVFRDSFGNLITNIASECLGCTAQDAWTIQVADAEIHRLNQTYGESPPGTLIALPGSLGWIEVAIVNGDAARQLTAGPGTTVWVRKRRG